MTFKDYIEVLSDIFGAASGFVLLFPTYKILSARRILFEQKRRIISSANTINSLTAKDILKKIEELDACTNDYDPKDTSQIILGIWFFILAFGLKIVYHWLDKA